MAVIAGVGLVAGCAGSPAVKLDPARCPDLTGTYCALGESFEVGGAEVDRTWLGSYLPGDHAPGAERPDRYELAGPAAGVLTVIARRGGRELSRLEVREPDLVCGEDRLVLKVGLDYSAGALGPVLLMGGRAGWNLVQRGDDGILRVQQKLKESVFVAGIPVFSRSESLKRFKPPAGQDCETAG